MNRAHHNSQHIFDHGGFTYVIDFDKMLCWVVDPDDKQDPISALDLERKFPSKWFYKPTDVPVEFTENHDVEWSDTLEKIYSDYVNNLVVRTGDGRLRKS